MSWQLVDRRYVAELHPWRESIMTVANGFLSTRGSLEEPHDGRRRATFLQGIFVTPAGGVPQQTAVPDWTDLRITVDGEPIGVDHGWLVGQERQLDLRSGELVRRLTWRGEHTPTVSVVFRRLVPLHEPQLAAMDVTVTCLDGSADIVVETGIDASVGSPDDRMWRPLRWDRTEAGGLTLTAASIDDVHHLGVDLALETPDADTVVIDEPFHHRVRATRRIEVGEPWTLRKRVGYRIGRGGVSSDGATLAVGDLDELVAGSRQAWDVRWSTAAIEVDGDPEAQLALRYAAFQLLAVAPRDDRASVPAKLLSGFGYLGHVFWDTDVFMVPWWSMVAPDLADNHLDYRWRGLPAARRKAARYGRIGAFFPWESDDRGEECTPDQVVPHAGGPPIEVHTARYEEHITADVAWTAWNHQRWTGDQDTLAARDAELILDTARYWGERVEVDADGSAHLRQVIGPDEYHELIDDSWYTNRMVRWHLGFAADLLDELDRARPETATRLRESLELDRKVGRRWRKLAERLVLLTRPDGTPLEHVGFDDREPVDLAAWTPRRTTMQRLLGPGIRDQQVVKQADVVMALALLGTDAAGSKDAAAAALDHYLPMTDHGSSLSLPVHAWLAARLGRGDQAYELLRAGIAVEHDDAMGNGGLGLHGATNGGLLLATLRGIGGVQPGSDGPTLDPSLPSHWRRLGFSVVQGGQRYDLEVS